MTLQPFSNEELNCFKFGSIVLDKFPKTLRQVFANMWNKRIAPLPGHQPWDDSATVRNLFLKSEGGKTKIPTNVSIQHWDCTALFQATLYAQTFALPDSKGHKRTLDDLYLKKHRPMSPGSFHSPVASPSGDPNETIALAVDQLRLLRNTLCHSSNPRITKTTFDTYLQYAKEAFTALKVNTSSLEAIGNLAEFDFPTAHELIERMKDERNAFYQFLEREVKAGLTLRMDEVNEGIKKVTSATRRIEGHYENTKSNISELGEKIDKLTLNKETVRESENVLPQSFLPCMVPHFTGRQTECEKIVGHMTSKSTRLVTIWGPPGFGKTSVAIAAGHCLKRQDLPVYYFSLRNVNSVSDLVIKLLNSFAHVPSYKRNNQPLEQSQVVDELCRIFGASSSNVFIILDNGDDLLECAGSEARRDVTDLFEEILTRCKNVTFLCTTRMSLEFLNLKFQDHESVKIGTLDEASSCGLVREFLSEADEADCLRITQICGRVPLAIKLLSSLITEDNEEPSLFLNEFCRSSQGILEQLDNPDSSSDFRLKVLFESSFKRLSQKEQEALVSLSVFVGEAFEVDAAAKVMGEKTKTSGKKTLQRLKRKCLIDSTTKANSFSFHPLIKAFVTEKGKNEMNETVSEAKTRFLWYYVLMFEDLNKQYLAGSSLSAFLKFRQEKENIFQSFTQGVSNDAVCDKLFDVLSSAELFLSVSTYFEDGISSDVAYNLAIKQAKERRKFVVESQLLVSKAFIESFHFNFGNSMQLLQDAQEIQLKTPVVISSEAKGRRLCYYGMCLFIQGNPREGSEFLENGVSLLSNSNESTILKAVVSKILSLYFKSTNAPGKSFKFLQMALDTCQKRKDPNFLFHAFSEDVTQVLKGKAKRDDDHCSDDQPLILSIIGIVGFVTKKCFTNITEIEEKLGKIVCQIGQAIEQKSRFDIAFLPIIRFISNLLVLMNKRKAHFNVEHPLDLVLKQYGVRPAETANIYSGMGYTTSQTSNYNTALEFHQEASKLGLRLSGEEQGATADSYFVTGLAQCKRQDYTSALQSHKKALEIRLQLFGEVHAATANSYEGIGAIQHEVEDYTSALESHQKSLNIRSKLYGREHAVTAESYRMIAMAQHELRDYKSALESHQKALFIRLKLFGEEHEATADSYCGIGVTQQAMKDYTSALQSHRKALNIRLKLFNRMFSAFL